MRWPGDEQFECPKCRCRLSNTDIFKFKSCPGCETRFAGDVQPVEVPPPPLPKAPAKQADADPSIRELLLGCVSMLFLFALGVAVSVAVDSRELRWTIYRYALGASAIFGVWRGIRHRGNPLIRIAVAIGSAIGLFVLFLAALIVKEPGIILRELQSR